MYFKDQKLKSGINNVSLLHHRLLCRRQWSLPVLCTVVNISWVWHYPHCLHKVGTGYKSIHCRPPHKKQYITLKVHAGCPIVICIVTSCDKLKRTHPYQLVSIRGEQIMLPIMLCCTAPKFYLLCSNIAPTMLIQNQVAYTSSVSKAVCVLLQQFSEVIYLR